MLRWFFLAVLLCVPAYAQTPPGPPPGAQPVDIIEIKPDTVIATVNGKPFTAGEFEMMAPNLPAELKELAATKPKELLERYALGLNLQAEAEKMKLDDQWPYRQRIADARRQILVEAVMAEKAKALKISPEDVREIYEARGAAYRQAKTKVIFCSRVGYSVRLDGSGKTQATPEEALAKAEKALKELREGRDFAEAAREYSDDVETAGKGADFPYPIRANSANVPQQIRDAVLAANAGDIVGPVEHTTGWYIFRIEEKRAAALDEVKSEIEKEMRDEAVRRFVEETRKKSVATLDHDAFWSTFLAANKEAQERREKQAQAK
jgi:peptidyl-prolyl cis-trans isomerase C